MNLKYVGIFVAILAVGSLAIEKDSPLEIKYKKITAITADNPYWGTMTTEISDSGVEGTARFSIKKSIPETVQISLTVELEGNKLVDYEDPICELMKNEIYGDDMLKHGLPTDKFPKGCPIPPGDYEISKYPIPKAKFPPGTPPGDYNAKMVIGEPGQDPWVIIDAIIEVSHKVPGFGR